MSVEGRTPGGSPLAASCPSAPLDPVMMSRSNADCYFFFNSTCTRGQECLFRHCDAALGSETVCLFWKSGNCVRPDCRFRHSDAPGDRSRRSFCFFESQSGGCQKPSCPFRHRSRQGAASVTAEAEVTSGSSSSNSAKQPLEGSLQTHCSSESTAPHTNKSISFHLVNDDESDVDEDKKSEQTVVRSVGASTIEVKTLEQIRMERVFKHGKSKEASSVLAHKRCSKGGEAEEKNSCKRVRLVRPKLLDVSNGDARREERTRLVTGSEEALADLLDGECEQSVESEKDEDLLQEIDNIINS